MGTSWSREAAALLECDVEEPQEPSSKEINYEKFFKDIDELREVRKLYDDAEDTACPKRLPHDFKWWPQDERGVFKDEGTQLGLDGTPVETVDELYQVAEPARYLFETTLSSFLRRMAYEDDEELRKASAACHFACASLKDRGACARKASRSHVSKVFDVVRGTLICDSEASLAALCDAMDDDEFVHIVRTKNRFARPGATGVRDLLASVSVDVAATLMPSSKAEEMVEEALPTLIDEKGELDLDALERHVTSKVAKEPTVAHRCELRITLKQFEECDRRGLESYAAFADFFAACPSKRTNLLRASRHELILGVPAIEATKEALLKWGFNVHGRSAEQLGNFAELFWFLGDREPCIEIRERAALAAAMKAGSVSRDHATHLTNLGLELAKHKRHTEAAAALEDARDVWEDVGSTGINAGKAIKVRARRTEELLHAGDVAAALANAREVLKEQRNPATLLALARCLRLCHEYADAEPFIREAMDITKEKRTKATGLYELASVLVGVGDPERAEECVARYEECIVLFEKLGDDRLGLALQGLANVHRRIGDSDRARDYQARAAVCLGHVLGREHRYQIAMGRACDVLNDMPDPDEEKRLDRDTEDTLRREVRVDAEELGQDHLQTSEAVTRLAEFLRATDRPAKALPLYRRALATIETRLGPKHAACCGARRKLGRCLAALGENEEASRVLKRALDLSLAAFGEDHVEVALVLCQYAQVVLKLGDEDKALGLFERSHAIHAKRPKAELGDAAAALNELADAVEARRGPRRTRDLFRRRAIAIAALAHGEASLEQAEPLERLAKDKVEEGSWVEALELSSRALEALRKGGDARHVAFALDRKATALQALGRAAEAEPLLREALAIHRTQSTAFEAATAETHLASALREAGRVEAAAPLLHHAIDVTETALGGDHPGTVRLDREAARLVAAYAAALPPDGGGDPSDDDAISYDDDRTASDASDATPAASPVVAVAAAETAGDDAAAAAKRLAAHYLRSGDARQAVAPARRAVALRANELGKEHPNTLAMVDLLGRCLGAAGQLQEAESLLRLAAGGLARHLGDDHPAVGASLSNLAAVVQKRGACAYYRGDYADASGARDYAEALYRRALGVFDRDARTPPETTLTALRNLGDCLVENGKPSQAAPVLGRVVQLRERLGLPLLGCVEDHAAMLHDAGKHAAAEAPYRRALALAQKAFGAESVDALPARENLAALLWDAGKAGEAEPEYRIVLERLEALVGGAHPDAAAARHDLGEVLVELGRGDEARPLLARALEGYGAYFAADHPDVVALEARLAGDLAPLAPGQGHRPRSTHRKGRGSRRSKVPPASSGVPEAPRP